MPFVGHSYVLVCHLYVIRMSLIYHPYIARMSSVCHLYVLVCHPYVTRMLPVYHSHITYMSLVCTCMSLVCTSMCSDVIRMSLVCTLMSSVCHSSVVLPYKTFWSILFLNMSLQRKILRRLVGNCSHPFIYISLT